MVIEVLLVQIKFKPNVTAVNDVAHGEMSVSVICPDTKRDSVYAL
jgi:hypothetical protein